MSNRKYIFFGYGGDYILNPVYEKMVSNGYECVEINFSTMNPNDILASIDKTNKHLVLVTSVHLFFNKAIYYSYGSFNKYFPMEQKYAISILQLMDTFSFEKVVYYPHDLVDGFKHFDRLWFSLIDTYLSPMPVNYHGSRFCNIIDVGWIKKTAPTPKYQKGDKITFGHGFSEYPAYLANGRFLSTFEDVWKAGNVRVKLFPDLTYNYFMEILAENNIRFYDKESNVYDMIDEHPVIITNCVTGINIEASFSGRMVINLLDGIHPAKDQFDTIYGLPNVYVVTIKEAIDMIKKLKSGEMGVAVGKDTLKPFNMELAIREIVS